MGVHSIQARTRTQVHKGKLGMSSRDFVHVWHRCTLGSGHGYILVGRSVRAPHARSGAPTRTARAQHSTGARAH
jgi:hypothetical protein